MGIQKFVKSSFEPVLIHIDKGTIHEKLRVAREKEVVLQSIVRVCESFLKRKLNADEKIKVLKEKFEGVCLLLKEQMGLPNADTDTILKLYGDEGKEVKKIFADNFKLNVYDLDSYKITANGFRLKKEAIEQIEKLGYYYTSSDKGNEALKIARTFIETYNDGVDNGFISKLRRDDFIKSLDDLCMRGTTSEGNPGAQLNYAKISRIR
ncbi:hypothetical protein [Ulvibacterium sp.]|uniref:hypothetical protein n=1 Tax=Ulvibacterium sp. TaxID=2665914 RepID=UPI002622722D|nr:hypothetical protein [Ulvibacterium sp.]